MKSKNKRYIIPIFVPHLGCPNDCIFCNQKKITNYKQAFNENEVIETIERYLSYFKDTPSIKEIAFFGGSFTAIDRELMIAYLKLAKKYKDDGTIDYIRLSTRPDAIDKEIINILKYYSVDIIELGVQSMNDRILVMNNRGHDAKSVYESSALIKEAGFILGHQIMPGLYGDSFNHMIKTARESIKIGPDIVRIYPTLIIKETQLEYLYNKGLYNPLSIEEAIYISKKLLKMYEDAGINVIRIGLQPTENINEGKDVVAGPFHPSFRSLVEQSIYYDILDKAFTDNKIYNLDNVMIYADNSILSYIVGNKSENKIRLSEKYKIKKIHYRGLKEEKIIIEYNKKVIKIGGL